MLEKPLSSEPEIPTYLKRMTIIPCIGPVIDPKTGLNAGLAHTAAHREKVPFWSQDLVEAAAELSKRNRTREFVVLGGQTGGLNHPSESHIVAKKMYYKRVPLARIHAEQDGPDSSFDTPTNFLNLVNQFTDPHGPIEIPVVDILAASYHLRRVKILAKFFALQIGESFNAEEVLLYTARGGSSESQYWNDHLLHRIERILSLTDEEFYKKLRGEEAIPYSTKIYKDDFWIREMLQFPERLLHLTGKVKSDARMKAMLSLAFATHTPAEMARFNLRMDDDVDTMRMKLNAITWPVPEYTNVPGDNRKNKMLEEWTREIPLGWPIKLIVKLKRLDAAYQELWRPR